MEYKQLDELEPHFEIQEDNGSTTLDIELPMTGDIKGGKDYAGSSWRLSIHAAGVSFARAVILIVLGFFFVLTTSLLVTGFQGLYPVLIKEGVCF